MNTQFLLDIHFLQIDMVEIKQFADLLKTIDMAMLTDIWGGKNTYYINYKKTLELISLLDAEKLE